jgi:hypothetical protein
VADDAATAAASEDAEGDEGARGDFGALIVGERLRPIVGESAPDALMVAERVISRRPDWERVSGVGGAGFEEAAAAAEDWTGD